MRIVQVEVELVHRAWLVFQMGVSFVLASDGNPDAGWLMGFQDDHHLVELDIVEIWLQQFVSRALVTGAVGRLQNRSPHLADRYGGWDPTDLWTDLLAQEESLARRWRERYQEGGYDGLYDRRRTRVEERRCEILHTGLKLIGDFPQVR